MKRLVSSMSGSQKGFTLIELLVVIAILGVIAAVVALNVAGFFGRGTLQAANTELHQAQTAIIAAMADAESNRITGFGAGVEVAWNGSRNAIVVSGTLRDYDAADYVYGPFRAEYTVNLDPDATDGIGAITDGNPTLVGGWGWGIIWDEALSNWRTRTATDPQQGG